MADIYEQHQIAFARVAAFVVLREHKGTFDRVATIAFKFPADGAGRLYVYVHWIGTEMVRGFAGGYGYDKLSAACASAVRKFRARPECEADIRKHAAQHLSGFLHALEKDAGSNWDRVLRDAGFTVLQAV